MIPTAILKVVCPDCEGLVAGITTAIARHHGNIISLDQFSDPQTQQFFMVIECLWINFVCGQINCIKC
ncbi:MAG: ACT domain-containing protein [Deltaproteobacteria bacterium]|nr:ACT domain-containing protein [Deltaproteobacteria bacterium]